MFDTFGPYKGTTKYIVSQCFDYFRFYEGCDGYKKKPTTLEKPVF